MRNKIINYFKKIRNNISKLNKLIFFLNSKGKNLNISMQKLNTNLNKN